MQGLSCKGNNKLEIPGFVSIIREYDVLLLSETWTSEVSHLALCGFDCYPLRRTGKKENVKKTQVVS